MEAEGETIAVTTHVDLEHEPVRGDHARLDQSRVGGWWLCGVVPLFSFGADHVIVMSHDEHRTTSKEETIETSRMGCVRPRADQQEQADQRLRG